MAGHPQGWPAFLCPDPRRGETPAYCGMRGDRAAKSLEPRGQKKRRNVMGERRERIIFQWSDPDAWFPSAG